MVKEPASAFQTGYLVAFEGLDGSGKSTQARLLIQSLRTRGLDSEYISFPRTNERGYGEAIAMFLRGEFGSVETVHPYLVAALFAGDRAAANSTMRSWLTEGKFVVADRYFYSNAAFQSAKLGSEIAKAEFESWIRFVEYTCNQIPQAHLTVFLDVPIEVIESNMIKRSVEPRSYLKGQADIHEASLHLQAKVAKEYHRLASTDPSFHVLSCVDEHGRMRDIKKIHSDVIKLLDSVYTIRKGAVT
jgi:dTMP kinase